MMIWMGHVDGRNNKYMQYFGEEWHSLENLCSNERIILKLFFKNRAGPYGLNSFGSWQEQVKESYEYANELLGFTKTGEFIQ